MREEQFFHEGGGPLAIGTSSYIQRKADIDLYENLVAGHFCYVLAARQMGKSSLSYKIGQKLIQENWVVAWVDIASIKKKNAAKKDVCFSFLRDVISYVGIKTSFLRAWWKENELSPPMKRLSLFLEEVVLNEITQPIAIFVDEIDYLIDDDRQATFNASDFFKEIRALYSKRRTKEELNRLHFSVFGVATPDDLMISEKGTPFNIGKAIEVKNFTSSEVKELQEGFQNESSVNKALIDEVFYWTGGQPYLTQELCFKLYTEKSQLEEVQAFVAKKVDEVFLEKGILNYIHFKDIQKRMTIDGRFNIGMLNIYREILKKNSYPIKARNPAILHLKLTGLVKEHKDALIASNFLYTQIFDHDWLDTSYKTIDRPMTMPIQIWLKSNKSTDALLSGDLLKNAESWAEEINDDLLRDEQEFLKASQMARQEVEAKRLLAAQKIEAEKRRQAIESRNQKRTIRFLTVVVVLFIGALILGVLYYQQGQETDKEKYEKLSNEFKDNHERSLTMIENKTCPKNFKLFKRIQEIAKIHPDSTEMNKKINYCLNHPICNN